MEKARFSASGEFLAVCGSDGRLKIWETATSSLKQEFVPSSHLSATCTCIEWAPSSSDEGTGKKKKRKKTIEGEVVAMGTATGSVMFYSVAKSNLLGHTKEGHKGPVTGLAWNPSTLALYSVGEDGYIIQWDAESATSSARPWGGGKSWSSVCMFKDFLITAGYKITLWNLETKTAIMEYLGHPSLITSMEPIPDTDYFVTMSQSERHLKIWSRTKRDAVATLSLSDIPQHFCVLSQSLNNVSVAAAVRNGALHIFQHRLNGSMKKPLMPSSTVHITDSNNESQKVSLLTSYLQSMNEPAFVRFGYGNWLRLRFEQLELKFLQGDVTIKREFSMKKKKPEKKSKDPSKIDVVEVPNDVTHLQPGTGADAKSTDSKGKKRKKGTETEEKVEDGELPMEERLSNLTIDTPATGNIPDGSNLAHLLSQGLHSKDNRILQSVLSRWDEDMIANTVRSLPVQLIVPLLNEIRTMLTGKAMLNHSVVRWLKTIFQVHSAFIMSCSSGEELLGPFMSLLRSRETLYPQMCQLKGKLELIKGNIESKEHRAEVPNEALLVYNDESSDEEAGEDDDLIPSESEEFIGSDDLGVDDEDDSEEETESESNEDSDSGAQTSEDEDDENKTANAKKTKKLQNHIGMENGTDDESMDEDG